MTDPVVLDTNVLVRHLTGDSEELSPRATRFLAGTDTLILTDVVLAECVHVLESVYRAGAGDVAARLRSLVEMASVRVIDAALLRRALDVYESGMDFVDAYLIAVAERSGSRRIASFDRSIDSLGTIERIEPL